MNSWRQTGIECFPHMFKVNIDQLILNYSCQSHYFSRLALHSNQQIFNTWIYSKEKHANGI